MKTKLALLTLSVFFVGCVPAPKPTISLGTGIGGSTQNVDLEYGRQPRNYASAIRDYFSSRLKHPNGASFQISTPKKAYKRKGLAYGGDVAWKGWLVKTDISEQSRTGRYHSAKPHMVLFSGDQIVEDILGSSHRLITLVDK